jgi:hypothetical protein
MRSSVFLALAACGMLFVGGCSLASTPIHGTLYTGNLKSPVMMGDNTAGHSKTGEAMATSIIGVTMGDCSIATAMQNGGITKVHHVDSEVLTILSVYVTYKTVVYGD